MIGKLLCLLGFHDWSDLDKMEWVRPVTYERGYTTQRMCMRKDCYEWEYKEYHETRGKFRRFK